MKDNYTIAFYNLENFFDTVNNYGTLDDDFTPDGFKRWDDRKFGIKAKKIAKTIAQIGTDDSDAPPVLIGIAEVENRDVIATLLKTGKLKEMNYDFVHFDSPDERGIDTALIYHKDHFKVIATETIPLLITNENGLRDFTRDILYVKGQLHDEEVHVFVNHWPSKRDGEDTTSHKRIVAAKTILKKLDQLSLKNDISNMIIMGDFNDDPNSESIKTLMASDRFINPMQKMLSPIRGSANYKGEWSLFDQIIISHSFLNYEKGTHSFKKAEIYAPKFLKEWKGKYKGNPFRTFVGKKYLGGYSDHFPVYIILKNNL
ncbi:endonuclease [uncultured Croceitalea sp.]|uniref:endonuclease/exonuclease/phosphatase family protein n=1 Tax=uncultured Croceitalea sp. TaxID=1798908 RepID=UPI00374E20FF